MKKMMIHAILLGGLMAGVTAHAGGFGDDTDSNGSGTTTTGGPVQNNMSPFQAELVALRVQAGITEVNGVRYESITQQELAQDLKQSNGNGGQIGTVHLSRMDQQTRSVQVVVQGGNSPLTLPQMMGDSGQLTIGGFDRYTATQVARGAAWQAQQLRQNGGLEIGTVDSEGAPMLKSVSIQTDLQSLRGGH